MKVLGPILSKAVSWSAAASGAQNTTSYKTYIKNRIYTAMGKKLVWQHNAQLL
jgi:hypothetical protein